MEIAGIPAGFLKIILVLLLAGAVPACFMACTPLYENIYEGAQMQKRQEAPPSLDAPEPAPGYDEYLRQRREVVAPAVDETLPPPAAVKP